MHLSSEFQRPVEEFKDAVLNYVADAYKFYVVAVGAVDTGELLESIHVEGNSIVASSQHAKVVEIGWTERAKGQASYPGRFPAQKAVEYTLESLQNGNLKDALALRLKA